MDVDIIGQDLCSLNRVRINRESASMKDMLKQLNSSEMVIHELEEGLESLYRSIVKTRVALLNVVSH